jgi:hypothetical protein
MDGSTILGIATLTSGSATVSTSSLDAASHTITATYSGDSNFTTSSGTTAETVSKNATTTALDAAPTTSVFGQSVTFTAAVSANTPGSGMPTGTVTFQDGSTILATMTLSGGSASYSTSALSVANHTITTTYNGDSSFSTSSANTGASVSKAGTTTSLALSANSVVAGQSVTFTAMVSVNHPGAGTPTGSVTFMEGGTTLGTAVLNSADKAAFTTSSLSVGQHTITAIYGGDASFATSISASLGESISSPTQSMPPVVTTGPLSFTTSRGGFFDLDLLVQMLASNGQAVGPAVDVPFPLDLLFSIIGANRDASGNVVLAVDFFFLTLHLDYNSAGQLTGLSF